MDNKINMDTKHQIELAKYISDYLHVQDCPHDAEHIHNAIECFYSQTYKELMIDMEAEFEVDQLFNVNESDQLGLYK